MNRKRVYGEHINIDVDQVKELYSSRADRCGDIHIDAPTVLSSDKDLENIELWTKEELKRWFPLFHLDTTCVVLEIGFGTGRMTKYITDIAREYVGIDYVEEFRNIVLQRSDIIKKESTKLFTESLEGFLLKNQNVYKKNFNRIFLSGGVFMYINDVELQHCIFQLLKLLQDSCLIYISEPIAEEERLTLDGFYSDTIQSNYSAIYRTKEEYMKLFHPLIENGFSLKVSQAFFENDFKKMKETQQWIFILER